MRDPTDAFFEHLSECGHEPRLEKATGTVRFDLVTGKRVERWLVSITKGDVAVSRGNHPADTVFRAAREDFNRLASGQANPMVMMLRGTASVEGEPEVLLLLQRLFPGPGSGDPRRSAGYARRDG